MEKNYLTKSLLIKIEILEYIQTQILKKCEKYFNVGKKSQEGLFCVKNLEISSLINFVHLNAFEVISAFINCFDRVYS